MAGSFSVSTEMLLCSVSSRQVAEMIGKDHAHLMRDIAGYAKIIESSSQTKFGLADFFIPSTYKDAQNKPRPCYLLTKSCAPGGCFGGRQRSPFLHTPGAVRRVGAFCLPRRPPPQPEGLFLLPAEQRNERNRFFATLFDLRRCQRSLPALCAEPKNASVPLRFRFGSAEK